MNIEVFILFFNATFVTVLSSVIVVGILIKQYRPVIKRLEKEQAEQQEKEGNEKDRGGSTL